MEKLLLYKAEIELLELIRKDISEKDYNKALEHIEYFKLLRKAEKFCE